VEPAATCTLQGGVNHGAGSCQPSPCLRHFECLEVDGEPARHVSGVSLSDEFGPSTVEVGKLKRLCDPTNKNNEDPSAPSDPDHLVGFVMRQTTPFNRVLNVQVVNQFGTLHVDLIRADRLLVPAAKSLSGSPPALVNPPLDHFKCYRVKNSVGAPRFTRPSGVQVQDQFGTSTVRVVKPLKLCVAANKNNEGVPDPSSRLMCYHVTASPRFQQPGPVFVNDQFGPDTLSRLTHVDELCVPSTTSP
jgi:hypothetical protein